MTPFDNTTHLKQSIHVENRRRAVYGSLPECLFYKSYTFCLP